MPSRAFRSSGTEGSNPPSQRRVIQTARRPQRRSARYARACQRSRIPSEAPAGRSGRSDSPRLRAIFNSLIAQLARVPDRAWLIELLIRIVGTASGDTTKAVRQGLPHQN
jgi:hypothetical protein